MKSKKENRNLVIWSIIGGSLIFIIWIISAILILRMFPKPEVHGAFGDLFGAVNALFSGLAFLGVIIAIILQKKELEEQRHEIKESRIAQEKTAMALSNQLLLQNKQTRMQSLNLLIASINEQIERLLPKQTEAANQRIRELSNKRNEYEDNLQELLTNLSEDQ